ncbi:MAG TPA: EAL domain-containing protein [Thermoleophilaceae bacterium]
MTDRSDRRSSAAWWTQQFNDLLATTSAAQGVRAARTAAIKKLGEDVGADFGAMLGRGAPIDWYGFGDGSAPGEGLLRAAQQGGGEVELPGLGRCHTIVGHLDHGEVVLGRVGRSDFDQAERHLLEGLARLLEIILRLERRRILLEQLTSIQEAISRRASLQEVFDTIVHAAARLLDLEMVAIRVADSDDPGRMSTPAVIGHPPELVEALRYGQTNAGATAAAPELGRLVVLDDYQSAPGARPEAVAYGVTTSMAAPLHEHGSVIGSLVVSSRERDRHFTAVDQDMFVAFCEHASLALAAARTGDTMRQALTDPLTGLANRALFMDRLDHSLARAARRGAAVSVIFVDLDRFKLVNDTLGHAEGDKLLFDVAARIRGCLRRAETAARLGGDEFAILLEEARDEMAAAHVAQRVASALREPFMLGDREVFVTCSIGIAVGTVEDAETLLRNADVAMYRAKGRGKDRYEIFEPEMHAEVMDRLALESELRRAVKGDELELHFQPAFKLESGEVLGVEALVRWRHPERGLLPPGVFIPLAEESGLILPLGRWVLDEACRQAAAWQPLHPRLQVAVNLSAWQLEQPDIVDEVAAVLERWQLPPRTLVLELTETLLMHDTEATIAKLQALKELEVRIAIDDFGTGYSSLQYLQRFPIDVLKIPKPFVDELAEEGSSGVLASIILDLCRRMDLGTVAEGIETEKQAQRLRELGCPWGQGFAFAKPMPVRELMEFLSALALTS